MIYVVQDSLVYTQQSAVEGPVDAGDHGAGGRGHVDAESADLYGLADAVGGEFLFDRFKEAGGEVFVQVRVDGAGGDGVDADAVIAEDEGEIAGENVDAGGVVRRVMVPWNLRYAARRRR